MNKNKNKINKKIIKNLGSNFILWILIIIISLTVLQYVTTNTKTVNISYKTFHDIIDAQNKNLDNILIEGRKSTQPYVLWTSVTPCISMRGATWTRVQA